MTPDLSREIASILRGAKDLTLATLREDGYPQATTVSYASDGLAIYFATAADSQKARNIARDERVSLAVNLPYETWGEIRGLSIAGRAARLTRPAEVERAGRLLLEKFPQGTAEYASGPLEGVAFFRVRPEVVSVLDYRKGFGHADLVTLSSETGAWEQIA